MKPAFRSALAQSDIQAAVDFYRLEAPHALGGFINALEKATLHIERAPGTGSPRYAQELNLPGLRFWPLTRQPYVLFYMEHHAHLSVIRLAHMRRDVPALLQDTGLTGQQPP